MTTQLPVDPAMVLLSALSNYFSHKTSMNSECVMDALGELGRQRDVLLLMLINVCSVLEESKAEKVRSKLRDLGLPDTQVQLKVKIFSSGEYPRMMCSIKKDKGRSEA